MAKAEALQGSIPPLVTPFRSGAVDYEAYAKLVAFQINNGSHGILVNGTTAEPSTLSIEERNRLVDIAVQVTHKRIPVVAATGSQSLRETQLLTEHAAKAGADALLIVTPYYIRPPQRGLVAYYLELARISELPWMVYHIPGRAAVSVTIDTLQELRAKSPTFVGMKHAVNDLGFVAECCATLGADFKVFVGLEELSLADDGRRRLRPHECGGEPAAADSCGAVCGALEQRSAARPRASPAAFRSQSGGVLRYQPDPDQVY